MIYDITRTVSTQMAVWPGDTPFTFVFKGRLEEGSSVNLTTWTLTPHLGTHMDGTFHYDSNGLHPAAVPLDPYLGPARVVSVGKSAGALLPEDFSHVDLTGVKRLLIHSAASNRHDHDWSSEYIFADPVLSDWLGQLGVILFGTDAPSVDEFTSKTLPGHHSLHRNGIFILEAVQLSGVPDGDYELIALPLKVDGVCGTPVRAILRDL